MYYSLTFDDLVSILITFKLPNSSINDSLSMSGLQVTADSKEDLLDVVNVTRGV